MHPLVQIAKEAVEKYIREGSIKTPPEVLSPEMKEKAGVFVCLKKKGMLRGCIGTFSPTKENVAEEVIYSAICAATKDPRFSLVKEEELDDIEYTVDVLSESEKVKGLDELDPKRYGVIVKKDWRRGLLLPDLEGVDTVEEQISIAKQKAGVLPDEEVEILRFEVKRYT
jgi:AmmeMemoRadiSam system protein A